ncbi:CGGC domain-containing protein [Desulfofundulus luciae]|nr:CGGC domain-containing protein [Desulfofundulus luciae]
MQVKWTKEALQYMNNVPFFVREKARKKVEEWARQKGVEEITMNEVMEARSKMTARDPNAPPPAKPRIAVVRCNIVSEVCPGVGCLNSFNKREQHFARYGPDAELIGFFTCGGCCGRRVSRLVEKLLPYDLTHVHLSSCMLLEGDYPRCPFKEQIKKTIQAKGVEVIEGTHH